MCVFVFPILFLNDFHGVTVLWFPLTRRPLPQAEVHNPEQRFKCFFTPNHAEDRGHNRGRKVDRQNRQGRKANAGKEFDARGDAWNLDLTLLRSLRLEVHGPFKPPSFVCFELGALEPEPSQVPNSECRAPISRWRRSTSLACLFSLCLSLNLDYCLTLLRCNGRVDYSW